MKVNRSGSNNPNYKGGLIEVCCDWCGKVNKIKRNRYLKNKNNFCNRECFGLWKSDNLKGENNYFFNKKMSDESKRLLSLSKGGTGIPYDKPKCIICGNSVSNRKADHCRPCYEQYFLLDNCQRMNKIVKKNGGVSGTRNPNYIDGRSFFPYTVDFNKELKEKIRKRDDYKCQGDGCTMTEEEHLIVYGQVLHIHHIDYDKKNCKETNLITTCLSCNVRANYNRGYWIEFYQDKISLVYK